ncbi:MAG: HAD hydrolase-like protein [Bacteroidales bacterium]
MNKHKKVIFWDWNGTLLNDVEICIKAMNIMLQKRGMALLDEKRYKEVFTFPVIDYYSALGFDFEKEPFEIPAIEFIDEYKKLLPATLLFDDVFDILEYFKNSGIKQYILSAMESSALKESIRSRNIYNYFHSINGLEDHYAHGKQHVAEQLMSKEGIMPGEVIMIGDTLHDYEIAQNLGIDLVLVDRGHQSRERLMTTKELVLNNLAELAANELFMKRQ